MHSFHSFLIDHFADKRRNYLWHRKGECLMSGVDTLDPANNDGTMILGLNPGGERLPALKDQVQMFFRDCASGWSCYLDQCWHAESGEPRARCAACAKTDAVKKKVHQRTVVEIAEYLGCDLHRAVTLNAIFTATKDATGLGSVAKEGQYQNAKALFIEVFYPVVSEIIKRSSVRRVICLGSGRDTSAFSLMAAACGAESNDLWSNHRADGRSFQTSQIRVFGIPHPSWRVRLSERGRKSFISWYSDK